MKPLKPHETIERQFCPECGRMELELRERHYSKDRLCPGICVGLVYRLEPQKSLCAKCGAMHAPKGNTLCDQ